MIYTYRYQLFDAWDNLVSKDIIQSTYEQKNPDGSKSDILIGIKNNSGKSEYYAKKKGGSENEFKPLEGKILERIVDGTNFIVQFNPFRGYKPGAEKLEFKQGIDNAPKPGIDECRFQCQKAYNGLSIKIRDSCGQIVLKNRRYNIYPNAFPIEESGHFMYIPVERDKGVETIPHIPQELTKGTIEDVLNISENCFGSITFFNSIHAGASVDHLHIQQVPFMTHLKNGGLINNTKYAIEHAPIGRLADRKILLDYPINGLVYEKEDVSQIWSDVAHFQEQDIPFNWILIGDRSYILPRKKEFERVFEFPNVLAALEGSGKIVTTNLEIYESVDKTRISSAFGKSSYTFKEIFNMINSSKPQKDYYDSCASCAEKTMGVGGAPCVGCSLAGV